MQYKSSEIGKMLKEAREKKNLTQEDLALKINKKRSYISRVENNGASVNLKTLQKIVEVGLGGKIKIEF
jgi:transcriptional regulator with XRE-family HTH domain